MVYPSICLGKRHFTLFLLCCVFLALRLKLTAYIQLLKQSSRSISVITKKFCHMAKLILGIVKIFVSGLLSVVYCFHFVVLGFLASRRASYLV
jgi:hypothetical protein